MWFTLFQRYSDPVERAHWRVAALQTLLREHRAVLNGRSPEEWNADETELRRRVIEARWAAQLLKSQID
jgi:hypothetical protein